jgi:hypothetical protein
MKQTEGATMKTMLNIIAGSLVVVGLMMAAGAGGDCDGKCMEYANSLGEMILYGSIGMVLMLSGMAVFVINSSIKE